jgi:hypothetical protein
MEQMKNGYESRVEEMRIEFMLGLEGKEVQIENLNALLDSVR